MDAAVAGHLDRPVVARVDVAQDAHRGIRRQDPLQLVRSERRPIRHHDHPGMLRVADPDPAPMVDRHP